MCVTGPGAGIVTTLVRIYCCTAVATDAAIAFDNCVANAACALIGSGYGDTGPDGPGTASELNVVCIAPCSKG